MSNAFAQRLGCFIATIAIVFGSGTQSSFAQQKGNWKPPKHDNSMNIVTDPEAEVIPEPAPVPQPRANPQLEVPGRGPIARLVLNPNASDGSPPFALADQSGRVQRYVEPVPGVDLQSHVGQVVVVRADTGPTLLASQLDLPSQPLLPMIMQPPVGTDANGRLRDFGVQQAQYLDNDDSSVQLMPDDMSLPGGAVAMPGMQGQLPLLGDGFAGHPGMPGMYGPGCGGTCGPECGPQCCDPVQCGGAPMMMPYPGPMVAPYPPSGYPCANTCGPTSCGVGPNAADCGPRCSADVEFTFYRVHMTDQVVGKLSEKYEFSPRFILTFQDLYHFDGRLRYWFYARDTALIGGGDVRPEFRVFDMEAIHLFQGRRSQLTLAGGVRLANVELTDPTGDTVATDLVGLTLAGDGLTPVLCHPSGYCGWVYGGRVSLLTGDWGGDPNSAFLIQNFDDDNMLVTELYAGIEVAKKLQSITLRGRAVFEMQNWRSDVLAQNANVESIGFFGPGLQIGADF